MSRGEQEDFGHQTMVFTARKSNGWNSKGKILKPEL